jgi:glycosyltransferase involved in cell wall biosynthesis
MLKAADALAAAGHRVRLVSTRHVDWAVEADADVRRRRPGAWDWTEVDYSRATAPIARLRGGARFRAAQRLAALLGPGRAPTPLVLRGYSRAHPELVRAALAEPADLFYGGTTGALAAVAEAGRRAGAPFALDLEDFHSAEQEPGPAAVLSHALAERIEKAVLPDAQFLTASSPAIAAAYADKYGVHPVTVHNTFPLPDRAPALEPSPGASLRLYWFSQTIGPGRGLEDGVRAMGLARISGELHLRGRDGAGYVDALRRLAVDVAPGLRIVEHAPAPPDDMVALCAGYDAGLSLEQGHVLSRALCLTNKAFTYILAGLAVVLTDTPGQRALAAALGDGAAVCAPGDARALAAVLKRWAEDKASLAHAKAAAWQAARRRWHWEHPEDRGALLAAVAKALR